MFGGIKLFVILFLEAHEIMARGKETDNLPDCEGITRRIHSIT